MTASNASATLRGRLRRLQPYIDVHSSVPSVRAPLAAMMGVRSEDAHPLLLLQAYSNEDKHRSIRVAVERTIMRRNDESFLGQDRSFREFTAGDVIGRTALGKQVEVDLTTAAVVERPDPFGAFVSPATELASIREYVADIAIPILVTGMALPESLPPHVDLGDNGKSHGRRVADGGWGAAPVRLGPYTAAKTAEAASTRVTRPRVVHEPAEGDRSGRDGD